MGLLLVKVLCCLIHIPMGSSSAILFFSHVTHILMSDIRNHYAEKSWEVFDKFLEQTPPLNGLLLCSFSSYFGVNCLLLCFFPHFSLWIGGKMGFYYKEHEILPPLPGKIWTEARHVFSMESSTYHTSIPLWWVDIVRWPLNFSLKKKNDPRGDKSATFYVVGWKWDGDVVCSITLFQYAYPVGSLHYHFPFKLSCKRVAKKVLCIITHPAEFPQILGWFSISNSCA